MVLGKQADGNQKQNCAHGMQVSMLRGALWVPLFPVGARYCAATAREWYLFVSAAQPLLAIVAQ